MRIAVISDIHGNQFALEAVLSDLNNQPPCDQIVIAGDICLHGPCPQEVLQTLRGLNCSAVQGNTDLEIVVRDQHKGEKKRNEINWVREQIGLDGINYLADLPFSYRVVNPAGSDMQIVHANPLNLEDALLPNADDKTLEHLLGNLDEKVGALAFGHLHIAYTRRWRNLLLTDVASCGFPRDEDIRAAYAILSWEKDQWTAEIRRVSYDVHAVVKQIKNSGMPNAEKRIKVLLEARY